MLNLLLNLFRADNDRLRGSLKKKEQDLAAAKSALERLTAAVSLDLKPKLNLNCQLVKIYYLLSAIHSTSIKKSHNFSEI